MRIFNEILFKIPWLCCKSFFFKCSKLKEVMISLKKNVFLLSYVKINCYEIV